MEKNIVRQFKETAVHLLKDPGVLFAGANVFAFSQSGNALALAIAVGTFFLAAGESCLREGHPLRVMSSRLVSKMPKELAGDPGSGALRINAYGVLAAGLLSLASGAVLPGIAGVAFATGSFFASSGKHVEIQRDHFIKGVKKACTNPAVFYGIGYAMIGLMAGGGLDLLTFPVPPEHLPALITTSLGVAVTTLSTVGLTLGKFKNPAAPFMAVSLGSCINVLAGVASGNALGVINTGLAALGEARLGYMNFIADRARYATISAGHTVSDRFFGFVSDALVLPLRRFDSYLEARRNRLAFGLEAK